MILLTIGYSLFISIYSFVNDSNDIANVQEVSGCTFLIISVMFAISGISINIRLKHKFNEFYKEHIKILWFATFGLSFPLLFRGSFDVARVYNEKLENFIKYHGSLYSPVFYIVGDLIPLCF